jgi:hypothetical protein
MLFQHTDPAQAGRVAGRVWLQLAAANEEVRASVHGRARPDLKFNRRRQAVPQWAVPAEAGHALG